MLNYRFISRREHNLSLKCSQAFKIIFRKYERCSGAKAGDEKPSLVRRNRADGEPRDSRLAIEKWPLSCNYRGKKHSVWFYLRNTRFIVQQNNYGSGDNRS